jgi:hypothetical protein
LSLDRPKVRGNLEGRGLHVDRARGIYLEFYYVVCTDPTDEFHFIEIRMLLRQCRDAWESIIDRHYLTKFDGLWGDEKTRLA